jgi:hypothetical protein
MNNIFQVLQMSVHGALSQNLPTFFGPKYSLKELSPDSPLLQIQGASQAQNFICDIEVHSLPT